MQLRWSPAAAEDLSELSNTSGKKVRLPLNIAKTIYESAGSLKSLPHKGTTGRVEGTVNFLCHRFPSWWFTESSKTLWKSQTSYTAHRNGRQKNEVESREEIAAKVGNADGATLRTLLGRHLGQGIEEIKRNAA